MTRDLLDLLWRDHPAAPKGGTRGPRSKVTTNQAVDAALVIADSEGLDALTVRRLAADLGISAMALYTHVGSRDDLVVLMADAVCARAERNPWHDTAWRHRVRQVADDDMAMYLAHPWLIDVTDQRTAFGPGTIAKYDHDLQAFDAAPLSDVGRDAALTFVADFVRSSARARRPDPDSADMAEQWANWHARLGTYVGDDYPLARRVGAAAGAEMNAAYSPDAAWTFGLDRVLDSVQSLIDGGTAR